MTEPDSSADNNKGQASLKKNEAGPNKEPDWTRGLKRLYDQVLEEPMPNSFKNLLDKLDDN